MKAKNLKKSFKKHTLFEALNINIPPRQGLGLVGPSGCGKTTLLRCLAGLEPLDKGHVERPHSMGWMVQEGGLFPHMTLWQNILYPALRVCGLSRMQAEEQAETWLGQFKLSTHKNHYPYQLSGGQCQRGAFIRLLMYNPKLILLDEPTSALDSKMREVMVKTLLKKKAEGASLVVISHDQTFLESVCDTFVTVG